MKRLIAIAFMVLLPSMGAQDQVIQGLRRGRALCSPPTMDGRWAVYDSGTSCAGACSNGSQISSLAALAGSFAAAQSTSANRPIYTTSAINGLPAAAFTKASSHYLGISGSTIPNTGQMTFYAVVAQNCTSSSCAMFGGQFNNALEYAFDSGTNKQIVNSQGVTNIGSSSTAVTRTTWATVAFTYNFSTGAFVFYLCSAGTCTADGSGTKTSTFGGTPYLGGASNVGEYFNGQIAEWGYRNSISTAGIAAWSQCKYGI